jgi:hypothetical protein
MVDLFWNDHYKDFSLLQPSLFAQSCLEKFITNKDTVVELGCGNGRDGLAISQVASRYIGLDACPVAVKHFTDAVHSTPAAVSGRLSVRQTDFTSFDFNSIHTNDARLVIYSRFSLHSINYAEVARLLDNVASIAVAPWIMVFEARTIFDMLYGQGEQVGRHEFRTDHYRRFIDPDEFLHDLNQRFSIGYFEINDGFAPFGDQDPILMRAMIRSRPNVLQRG